MVRHLIKNGKMIKLLPLPKWPEEESHCSKCNEEFDHRACRRACWYTCGHISCLNCILDMSEGCDQCSKKKCTSLAEPLHIINEEKEKQEVTMSRSDFCSETSPKHVRSDNDNPNYFRNRISTFSLPTPPESTTGLPFNYIMEEDASNDGNQKIPEEICDPLALPPKTEDDIPLIELSSDEESVHEPNIFHLTEGNEPSSEQVPTTVFSRFEYPHAKASTFNREEYSSESDYLACPMDSNRTKEKEKSRVLRCREKGFPNYCEDYSELEFPVCPTTDSNVSRESDESMVLRPREDQESPYQAKSVETGFGTRVCVYCSRSFVDKKSLGRHLYQEHWDVRPYPCPICDFPFVSNGSLQNHILIHTGEQPFQCSTCGSRFNRKYNLKVHMKTIHGLVMDNRSKKNYKYKFSSASRNHYQFAEKNYDDRKDEFNESFNYDGGNDSVPTPVPVPIVINL